jgi:hypothetical protein
VVCPAGWRSCGTCDLLGELYELKGRFPVAYMLSIAPCCEKANGTSRLLLLRKMLCCGDDWAAVMKGECLSTGPFLSWNSKSIGVAYEDRSFMVGELETGGRGSLRKLLIHYPFALAGRDCLRTTRKSAMPRFGRHAAR